MRSVFFGTPEIAVPVLRALDASTEVVGVVCQLDRPRGRGLHVTAPPVKLAALELGLEVHQPVKVKTGTLHEWIAVRQPDVALILAYGRILPPNVLGAPRRGCMNLHASLLPKYRGAAPINWSIVQGETETGVSLMQMDEGMDTGPVYAMRRLSIGSEETAGELATRLAELAAEMVREDLPRAVSGELVATPQDDARASYAPLISAKDTEIDWTRAAPSVVNLVRGMTPRPGAHSSVGGKRLNVLAARAASEPVAGPPGTVRVVDRRVLVAAGDAAVEIVRAQLEGKKPLGGADLVNGRALAEGDKLGG
jgi:methionyl-tRNA formyltransferase